MGKARCPLTGEEAGILPLATTTRFYTDRLGNVEYTAEVLNRIEGMSEEKKNLILGDYVNNKTGKITKSYLQNLRVWYVPEDEISPDGE